MSRARAVPLQLLVPTDLSHLHRVVERKKYRRSRRFSSFHVRSCCNVCFLILVTSFFHKHTRGRGQSLEDRPGVLFSVFFPTLQKKSVSFSSFGKTSPCESLELMIFLRFLLPSPWHAVCERE
jgi:hypothetical protein